MKKIIVPILLCLGFMSANSQEILNKAQASAKKEHKLILLNFSGSDWCLPCMRMQKNYFENETFLKMADSQLIIIRADFPRKKKNLPAADIVKENEALAERFNKQGSFPFTLLLDNNLQVLRRWDGFPEEELKDFIATIDGLAQKNK